MGDKIHIPAIHDDDLAKILEKHGLAEKLKSGELHCTYCNEIITIENLYAIFWKNDLPNFVCDSPDCINKAMNQENG